jgi:hypothetical protein
MESGLLPAGWYLVDHRAASHAVAELARGLHPSHALYGLKVAAVARRRDSDEWLFEIDSPRVAQVHLTYAVESTPTWPRARIFANMAEWEQSTESFPGSWPSNS